MPRIRQGCLVRKAWCLYARGQSQDTWPELAMGLFHTMSHGEEVYKPVGVGRGSQCLRVAGCWLAGGEMLSW